MRAWWWGSASSAAGVSAGSGPPLALEGRLRRVTANDIAHVTPRDVARVKQQMSLEDLHCAMRVMLGDNRYAEVLEQAPPSSLRSAAHGLSATQLSGLMTISKSNFLALYNVLPYTTQAHLAEMTAISNTAG
ncbi:uncharacterized protein Tco025E_01439 [Trypanosoma conorhini]|uniref:Uncharacterized protein n=1 Tax=Trypanosoma conorhini TaxID=83891 RepID=A0A3S5IUJ8_9TRYP|nr:uncharacterized protein Tco025E_01439 [Trypanosoma conorhini]RNF26290.1 hypothetical protein Tco025E_01439 [Trypanosoma conorhini]